MLCIANTADPLGADLVSAIRQALISRPKFDPHFFGQGYIKTIVGPDLAKAFRPLEGAQAKIDVSCYDLNS